MQARIAVALAAVAVAGVAAARLSTPAVAATPWGEPPAATTSGATQPAQGGFTAPATVIGKLNGGTTTTPTFTESNPYSCTIQPFQTKEYTLVITNNWTAYMPVRMTSVQLCGPSAACVSFSEEVGEIGPGATQSYTINTLGGGVPPPGGLTSCTATGATPAPHGHGPH